MQGESISLVSTENEKQLVRTLGWSAFEQAVGARSKEIETMVLY